MQLYACSTAYIGSGVYRNIERGPQGSAGRKFSSGVQGEAPVGVWGLRPPEAGAFSKK
jgi:hypothetical protein